MVVAIHSAAGKFGILAILLFFVGTIVRLSFPDTLYVPQFHGGHREGEGMDDGRPPFFVSESELRKSYKPEHEQSSAGLRDIYNATLGFQKIYVLSMPTRRDKRDMIALAAYLSGLEIEFVDGVNGTIMSKGERPDGYVKAFGIDGNLDASLGCWRGHMDIYQKMVQERIQTALIVEDDSDWDVLIKAQMTEIARGARHIQHQNTHMTHSPYGDDWWLISTGNCAVRDLIRGEPRWVIENDPTVPPQKERHFFFTPNNNPDRLSSETTRHLFTMGDLVCTGSYAISLEGVTNMLYDQTVEPNAKTIDFALGDLCKGPAAGKCLGVHPPITGIYIPAGDRSKESDRQEMKGKNEHAWALHIVYSVRLNLKKLLQGDKVLKSQWPAQTMMQHINKTEYVYPTGQMVNVTKSEYEAADRIVDERKKKAEEEKKAKEEEKNRAKAEQEAKEKQIAEEAARKKAEEEVERNRILE